MHRLAAAAALTMVLAAAAVLAPAFPAAAAPASGCTGWSTYGGWYVQCGTSPNPGGGNARGGGTSHPVCTWHANVNSFYAGFTKNSPKPPKGQVYMVEVCGNTFGLPQLIATAGALNPAVLARQAYAGLRPPQPNPQTAPPRGSDGLVGLPEWVWVPPGQWQPLVKTLRVGPVWATVTAAPSKMTFSPGGGAAPVSCAGPGTPYNTSVPAGSQHTTCSYTYAQSSAEQPGNAYQASVTLTWTATWAGSGGAGGAFPALSRTTTFALPVAEAQALNPGN